MKEKARNVELRISAPQADNGHSCGRLNRWSESADPMKEESAGTWRKTKVLTERVYECKCLVDGEWSLDPECQDTTSNEGGTEDNVIYPQIALRHQSHRRENIV